MRNIGMIETDNEPIWKEYDGETDWTIYTTMLPEIIPDKRKRSLGKCCIVEV